MERQPCKLHSAASICSLSFSEKTDSRNKWFKKCESRSLERLLLAYLDSNQDKQNQNLSYYHYTIGQSPFRGCKNKAMSKINQKFYQIDQLLPSRSFNSLILSNAPATTSHMIVYKAPGTGFA